MTTAIALPEPMIREASSIVAAAQSLVVNDDDSYRYAGEFQRSAKQVIAKIDAFYDPLVESANKTHKTLTGARKADRDPVQAAADLAARKMGAYKAEMERQRIAEEAALKAKAAEEARLANELMAQAAEEDIGTDDSVAESIRAVEEVVVAHAVAAVHVENLTPKVDGQVSRANWKFEVVDANLIPREYMTVDLKAIGAMVRARKDATNIPGVRVYPDYKVTV